MNHQRRFLAFPISAFLLLWLVPWLQLGPWGHEYSGLSVLKYGHHSNALSTPAYLLRAIGLGLLAVLLVEPIKWMGRSTFPVRLIGAAYQISLLVDAVRVNALDWFAYWLHFLGVAELEVSYGARPAPPISLPFPWISLGALVLVVGATAWQRGVGRQARLAEPSPPSELWHSRRPTLIILTSLCIVIGVASAVFAGFNSWLAKLLDDPLYWRRAAALVAIAGALLVAAKRLVGRVRGKRMNGE